MKNIKVTKPDGTAYVFTCVSDEYYNEIRKKFDGFDISEMSDEEVDEFKRRERPSEIVPPSPQTMKYDDFLGAPRDYDSYRRYTDCRKRGKFSWKSPFKFHR